MIRFKHTPNARAVTASPLLLATMLASSLVFTGAFSASAMAESPFAPIEMSSDKLAVMGIKLASPTAEGEEEGVPLAATVVIPPGNERVVSSPESARIESLAVAEGDEVAKGQALAVMLSPDLLTLQKDYLQAVAEQALARQQFKRDEQLVSEGIVAARRLEESRTRLSNQSILVEQQASSLRIAGFTDEEIRSLRRTGKLRQRVTLRSPLDGVVLKRMAEVGQQVSSGDMLFRIADLSTLWLQVRVPVGMQVEKGQKAEVVGRDVTAEVTLIGQSVDPESQTFFVRAKVLDGVQKLRAGEALSVRLSASKPEGADTLSLPRSAVVSSGGMNYVFVKTPTGFEARAVRVAGYAGSQVLIARGLSKQDKVAVAGVAALKAVGLGLGGDE